MSNLLKICTARPEHEVTLEHLKDVGRKWLSDDPEAQEKFLRLAGNSGVSSRRFILPYDEILALKGLEDRAKHFEKHGTRLLIESIRKSLEENEVAPDDIGAVIVTSCSVPIIPAIDTTAILQTAISPSVSRVPIYQQGCAGGVVGLALGAKLSTLGKPVIVASVELCSLVFQPANHAGAQLVGTAIFADGCASTVISPEQKGIRIVGSESYLIPETRHLMGYDVFDDGFHLRLDRTLPGRLVQHAPSILRNFLKKHGKEPRDVPYWLFHPGGVKILNFLQDTFQLSKDQCSWSYDVLRHHGNLSSATILYVAKAFNEDVILKSGESAVIMGIGPGLTIEMILLEGQA